MANEFIARNGLISQNNSIVTGSLTVTAGITGSLFGTATTASFVTGSIFTSTNRVLSASNALTASYALNISDTAYDATSWNGVTDVAPSKNAVRDKIESTGLQQILDIGRTATLTDDTPGVSITLNSPDIAVISATGIGGTNAIKALTDSGVGVYAQSSTNYGVHGYSDGFAAIFGESNNGHGVYAQSTYNVALVAYGSEPEVNIADFYGVGGAKVSIKYDGEVTASRVTAAKVTATSITGSLFGTATNAVTASFAPSYVLTSSTSSMSVATASFVTGSIFTSGNPALSSSYALTASFATTAIAKNSGSTYTTNTITTVTAAEYAAIGTKDATTLYFIV